MMYLIGTEEQRERFADENRIPYFEREEYRDPDMVVKSNHDDEKAALVVNILEEPLYTVQVMGEEGGVESETDYQDYERALAAYEAHQAHGAREGR